jgi:hypothetical protein
MVDEQCREADSDCRECEADRVDAEDSQADLGGSGKSRQNSSGSSEEAVLRFRPRISSASIETGGPSACRPARRGASRRSALIDLEPSEFSERRRQISREIDDLGTLAGKGGAWCPQVTPPS